MTKALVIVKDILICLLVIFVCGELALRFIYVRSDPDGNLLFGPYWLRPHHLPMKQAKALADWEAMPGKFLDYDPVLGWAPVPGTSSKDALFRYNQNGLRSLSPQESVAFRPGAGVLRVALFGDSYTHGGDSGIENTWGYRLREEFKSRGINAEVLNFGVSGYGMDQALLRWQKEGYKYAPHIVIFGLQVENIKRNVNLMRYMFHPAAGMLLFKPRFILDHDRLKLVNSPPPPPQRIFGILSHYDSWEFSRYEYWYDPVKYKDDLWLKSRLISLILYFLDQAKGETHRNGEDPDLLSLKIIQEFKEEVESRGARFLMVYLPHDSDTKSAIITGRWPSARFLSEAEKVQPLIHPERELLNEARRSSVRALFADPHYTAKASKIVASVIAGSIAENELNKMRTGAEE